MNVIRDINEMQGICLNLKKEGKRIGFVPTMGAIHDGHLSLVNKAKDDCDVVIASAFVNPAQFSQNEDFENYPRNIEDDQKKLELAGVSYVFEPGSDDFYPFGFSKATRVYVPELSKKLCGHTRPHFFRGVCMAVSRLFNIINPDVAYFGEKDHQQYIIIKRMVEDLHYATEIKVCPTIREVSGLAMSSRNQYLNTDERDEAARIFKTLKLGVEKVKDGQIYTSHFLRELRQQIEETGSVEIDYLTVVDSNDLKEHQRIRKGDRIMFAGYIGDTRLTDNIIIE